MKITTVCTNVDFFFIFYVTLFEYCYQGMQLHKKAKLLMQRVPTYSQSKSSKNFQLSQHYDKKIAMKKKIPKNNNSVLKLIILKIFFCYVSITK